MPDNKNRFNAILPDETQKQLTKLSKKTNGKKTEAVRRAIAVASFIEDAISKGETVQVVMQNGKTKQIIFI